MKLEDHPDYVKGQEHHFFVRGIRQGLEDGGRRFAEDTEKRSIWYDEHSHHFPDLMLIGTMAYLEGALGQGWITKHAGRHRPELNALRLIRNALVHKQGDLNELAKRKKDVDPRKGRPADPKSYILRFRRRLVKGDIVVNGVAAPPYFDVRNGVVRLNDHAYDRIYTLALSTLRQAGRY